MAVLKYQNPETLPDSIEEASQKYFDWLEEKDKHFVHIRPTIGSDHCIIPMPTIGGGLIRYFVSGGIIMGDE